jgi:hypothetical protein
MCPTHLINFQVQVMMFFTQFSPVSCYLFHLRSKYFCQLPVGKGKFHLLTLRAKRPQQYRGLHTDGLVDKILEYCDNKRGRPIFNPEGTAYHSSQSHVARMTQ